MSDSLSLEKKNVEMKKEGMSRTKKVFYGLFLLFLIFATIWIVRFRGTATLRTAQGTIFGTTYHVKYESSEVLDEEILAELKKVDSSLSVFNTSSTLSRINRGETEKADFMLYEVLQKAAGVMDDTNDAFDVTVMPLVNAWGFGFKKGDFPTEQEIDSLRQFVGPGKYKLTKDSLIVKSDPRVMIDCGAIAKGYGVDRVARLLREHGVMNFMVEIGGEVVTKGRNPKGNPWQIGINRPVESDQAGADEIQTVLSLENSALATSGNYRNYYERDGKKYAHTIDPRTGKPVQHSLLSATVIARDCATADAYATAFMVLGLDSACQIVADHRDLRAYLIYADEQGKMKVVEPHKKR